MESFDDEYDYDNTTFSPDGRLFQVEYARETINKGSTTLGLKYCNGVLLASYKNFNSSLIESSTANKIKNIDDEIICSYVGLSADARLLIDYSQEIAANYKMLYNEKISIRELVEEICFYKHLFTLYNGLRPFGLVLIYAGIDNKGVHLFATDPSGSFLRYKAICEGIKKDIIIRYFEKHYDDKFNKDKAIKFAIDSIKKANKKFIKKNLEIIVLEKK